MKKILVAVTLMIILLAGLAFGGQCTGGDKRGLNPQPLPPGRRSRYRSTHHRKHRKHRRSTAYSPQWGGRRNTANTSNNKPK